MADQRTITLRQGHGTSPTIILRALPVADVVTTKIVIYGLHVTPATIVLRNPLAVSSPTGGIVETTATSNGAATCTGLAAAVWNSLGASDGLATVTGLSAAIGAMVGSSAGLGTAMGESGAIGAAVASVQGVSVCAGIGETIGVESGIDRVTYTGPPPRITSGKRNPNLVGTMIRATRRDL